MSGATTRSIVTAAGVQVIDSGAVFVHLPTLAPPSLPPSPPPPPYLPPPRPPGPPPSAPSPANPSPALNIVPIVGGGAVAAVFILPLFFLYVLSMIAPNKYRRLTRRCRKPVIELSEEDGRGPVADQLRAILADKGFATTPVDLYRKWDKDGGGSVSRKEFRSWWPSVGYAAPVEDLNELFDEFDVDGSGEVDMDEFTTAFEQRGRMWQELGALQKQQDESQAIHLAIKQLRAKIGRQEKARIIAEAARRRLDDKMALRLPTIESLEEEITSLTGKQEESQRKLDSLMGGLKAAMQSVKVINAFKAAMTPDDAAVAIQSRVRVRAAQKMVHEKKVAASHDVPQTNKKRKPGVRHVDEWFASRKAGSGFSGLGLSAQVMPHSNYLENEVAALRRQLAKQEEGLRRMSLR